MLTIFCNCGIDQYIDQYNWKEINFPSNKKDRNKFEKK